jgi:hypothetical protein
MMIMSKVAKIVEDGSHGGGGLGAWVASRLALPPLDANVAVPTWFQKTSIDELLNSSRKNVLPHFVAMSQPAAPAARPRAQAQDQPGVSPAALFAETADKA